MKTANFALLCAIIIILATTLSACGNEATEISAYSNSQGEADIFADSYNVEPHDPLAILYLPAPDTDGDMSVEEALASRRSHRNFLDNPLTIDQLSQILWAAYGVTAPRAGAQFTRGGLLAAPSAGALYPLEIYAVVGNVEGLEPGVYRYITDGHKLEMVAAGDVRSELADAALGQRMVRDAPLTIFYSAVFDRTTNIYGERGVKYVYMEVGHSAQNIYLQVEAMGLGTVAIGAFRDDSVRQILNLPEDETPLYLMPVGYRALESLR